MALSKIRNDSLADTAVHGRRNHIINGSFQVWQRSDDIERTTNGWGYFSVDRFQHNKGRYRQVEETVDGRTVKAVRIDPSSGVYNGGRGLFTMLEDYHVYDKPTVLSVWAKADAATTAKLGTIYDYGTSTTIEAGNTINITTSWQRFEIAYTAKSFTEAAGQYILNGLVDGRTYYVAMAQLEDGDKATPFEHRSFGEELALCQRYYQDYVTGSAVAYMGYRYSGASGWYTHTYPVEMRAAPTITVSTWQGATPSVYNSSISHCVLYSSTTQFYANTNSTFTASAEL